MQETTRSENSDEEMMRRYLSGDTQAFAEIYRRHSTKVYAYLHKKLSIRAEVEDLHQAVFLKFHRVRHRYDPKYPVLQWLFVIARTSLVDFYRKQGRQVPAAEGVTLENVAEIIPAGETSPESSQSPGLSALEGLSQDQRQLVEMKYIDELTYEEMAARLGRSSESLRQTVSRALRKIRGEAMKKGRPT